MAEQKSSALTAPLRGAASVLRRVPGAGTVSRAAEGTLDKIGAVSPRGRRMAVYAGAGVLGVAGVVEWPVALTGAAVAWLTQPRPADGGGARGPEPAHDLGTAALRSGTGKGTHGHGGATGPAGPARAKEPGPTAAAGPPEDAPGVRASAAKPSSGPLGPTARPDRTTL
ncbi:hypothetical protein [Streptomyces naphthomycinicus]|uniref:hypothetical protein n=1 Tax=Streptomyces naphthomycinicus TaxID=2872625 RepID=UPI001CEC9424|nr:hypothetical protein [Streptomyces sp. TML10]